MSGLSSLWQSLWEGKSGECRDGNGGNDGWGGGGTLLIPALKSVLKIYPVNFYEKWYTNNLHVQDNATGTTHSSKWWQMRKWKQISFTQSDGEFVIAHHEEFIYFVSFCIWQSLI